MTRAACKPWAVRALSQRLGGDDIPAWASYLPPKVCQISFRNTVLCDTGVTTDSCRRMNNGSTSILEEGRVAASGEHAIDPSIRGRVWELSQQSIGCREVQRGFDCHQNKADKARLAFELRGHVLEALVCPYANHVLQKCINSLQPSDLQFIIDELLSVPGAVERSAMHKYGCRIVQRLLEACPSNQVAGMAETLVSKADLLIQHAYGNYVMQCLLQNGTILIKRRLVQRLVELPLLGVCSNVCSRAVVKVALCEAAEEDALMLTRSITQTPGLVSRLAREKCSILKFLKGTNLSKQNKAVH